MHTILIDTKKAYFLKANVARGSQADGKGIEMLRDELTALINTQRVLLNENAREQFETDIKKQYNSKYKRRGDVRQGLKIIHDKIMKPDASVPEKTLIALKLQERAGECEAGFHDGVNAIIDGFYLAHDLDDLLYRVRMDLVARAAHESTNEVHANNRFFTLAAPIYGVKAINPDDVYTGTVDQDGNKLWPDGKIKKKLKQVFDQEMHLFGILQRLEEQLRGQLTMVGYEGLQQDGYTIAIINGMSHSFNKLFHDHPVVTAKLNATRAMNDQKASLEQARNKAFQTMQQFAEKHAQFTDLEQDDKWNKISVLLGLPASPKYTKWAKAGIDGLDDQAKKTFETIKLNYSSQTKQAEDEKLEAATAAYNGLFFIQENIRVC